MLPARDVRAIRPRAPAMVHSAVWDDERETAQAVRGRIAGLERELKTELPKEIQRARELGDLRENAEYQAAKERQTYVNARIAMLKRRMNEVALMNIDRIPHGKAGFGSNGHAAGRRRATRLSARDARGCRRRKGAHLDLVAHRQRRSSTRKKATRLSVSTPAGTRRFEIDEAGHDSRRITTTNLNLNFELTLSSMPDVFARTSNRAGPDRDRRRRRVPRRRPARASRDRHQDRSRLRPRHRRGGCGVRGRRRRQPAVRCQRAVAPAGRGAGSTPGAGRSACSWSLLARLIGVLVSPRVFLAVGLVAYIVGLLLGMAGLDLGAVLLQRYADLLAAAFAPAALPTWLPRLIALVAC